MRLSSNMEMLFKKCCNKEKKGRQKGRNDAKA
jgi:hypothetical protein